MAGSFASAVARKLLSLYYWDGSAYRIPRGPNRGLRMRFERKYGYQTVLGSYDRAGFRFLDELLVKRRVLPANGLMCDVGAHIGLYAAFFAVKVVPAGKVYAFEAAPATFNKLLDIVSRNEITNIVPENMACTDRTGMAEFFVCSNLYCSSLDVKWAAHHGVPERVEVPATGLDEYFSQRSLAWPDFIKLDIEGGGATALVGAARCIREKRPVLWVELHNRDEERAIGSLMRDFDYQAFRLDNLRWVSEPDDIHPNPNGVWGTMILSAGDRLRKVKEALGERQ